MVERKAGMPISIKNEVTERLARQLAKETGESLSEAVHRALEERLERLPGRRHGRVMAEKFEDILKRVDALPTLDTRPEDEILGYDKQGIPTDGH
jgi:antitoxin VapB